MERTPLSADSLHAGHRARLKERFKKLGADGLADYELLELLLTFAIPRRDVKPMAKQLILRCGSFDKVFDADDATLKTIAGIGESAISLIRLTKALGIHQQKARLQTLPRMENMQAVIHYLHARMDGLTHEEFYVLYLNSKNDIIADERLFRGSLTGAAIYPKEIIKQALNYGAAGLIIAHNHPSGDPSPSPEDEAATADIAQAALVMDIVLHDHLIIGRGTHFSFQKNGLL